MKLLNVDDFPKNNPFVLAFLCVFAASCWLLVSGCATAPPLPTQKTETDPSLVLLSNAASQLSAPDAPEWVRAADEADAQWNIDKSLKVSVHEIWAVRAKPSQPLPPLATLNTDSEVLKIQSLKRYSLNSDGTVSHSPFPGECKFSPPAPDLPPGLACVTVVQLPDLNAGEALEVRYTLETKTSSLPPSKPVSQGAPLLPPVRAEGSLAFSWNDFVPAMDRGLTVSFPKDLRLYAVNLRFPGNYQPVEQTVDSNRTLVFSVPSSPSTLSLEPYAPPRWDMAPFTGFTLSKSWEEAVMPYRKRIQQYLTGDLKPVNEQLADALGNTTLALMDRLAKIKEAIHQKVEFVDTGLPVYLNPDRSLSDILESGKGSSHDLTVLFVSALKSMRLNPLVYLYRKADSGNLVGNLPALAQLDGVLVAVVGPDKGLVWMDPTEPLAAPNVLPLNALDRQALAVLSPLAWKNTPLFLSKEHHKERDVTAELMTDGSVHCAVDLRAYGSTELSMRQFFRQTSQEARRSLVLRGLSKRYSGVTLEDYQAGDFRDLSQPLTIHYSFTVPRYAEPQPKKGWKIYPLVFDDVEEFLANLRETRETPVVAPQNFNSITRELVKLPGGFRWGDLPKDITFSNDAADFVTGYKLQFGTMTFERDLSLKQRVIAPGKEYTDLQAFYQIVLSQDRTPFKALFSR
jgi:hypothetical protein